MLKLPSFILLLLLSLSVSGCGTGSGVNTRSATAESGPVVPWSGVTVTGSVVNLRSGPGTMYAVVGTVKRGDSLQVTGGVGDWYRVYVPWKSLFAWIYAPLTSGTDLP